jgi:hypothetical protein
MRCQDNARRRMQGECKEDIRRMPGVPGECQGGSGRNAGRRMPENAMGMPAECWGGEYQGAHSTAWGGQAGAWAGWRRRLRQACNTAHLGQTPW